MRATFLPDEAATVRDALAEDAAVTRDLALEFFATVALFLFLATSEALVREAAACCLGTALAVERLALTALTCCFLAGDFLRSAAWTVGVAKAIPSATVPSIFNNERTAVR